MSFPATIGQTARERRIDETFGWFPGAAAMAALFFTVARVLTLLLGNAELTLDELEVVGGALVVFGLFAFWEIFRRSRPTSLVLEGSQLGIYRKGHLSEVAGFGQLTHYRLSVINTAREVIAFGILALGGGIGFAATLSEGHLTSAFYALAALVLGAGGLASCLWSRAMCVHYWIPKGGGTETVVLRRSDLTRVGWRVD